MKENGYMTVYLALTLGVLISLCLALTEGCRYGGIRLETECVMDIGMDSLLAEYHRELFRQYNLFAIDCSYGTATGTTKATEQRLLEYMNHNFSLTACGSSSKGGYGISDLMDADYSVASNEAAAPEASAYEDGFGMTEGYDSVGNAQDTSTTVPEETADTADRKLIKTVNMDVETREYDKLLSAVENKVTELGGYIESLDAYNGSTYYSYRSTRNANLTIRIPKDRLEEFQNTVSELGNVTSRSENVQDVTLTYVDLQSHRDALQTEQERLLQLLEQAESIEDIITIEQRLSDVRYQLESMESQLRSYDNQVDYSTVYLYIDEVEVYTPVEEETTWERISAGFMDSLKSIGEGIKEAAIWFVIHIPYLVIWAIVIVIIVLILKKIKKRTKRIRAEEKKKFAEEEARMQKTLQNTAENTAENTVATQNSNE